MKRILFIFITLFLIIVCFTGCGITDKVEATNAKNKQKYVDQANANVESYLADKYPEMKYEITSTFCKQKSSVGIFDGIIPVSYSPNVIVYIEDEYGDTHSIYTNASLKNINGVESCQDNIQYDSIELAIKEMLYKTLPIERQYINHISIHLSETHFHTKYRDDILRFLKVVSQSDIDDVQLFAQYFYDSIDIDFNIITRDGKELLSYFETAVFVDYKDKALVPNRFLASSSHNSILHALKPFVLNIENIHLYSSGGFSVYKNIYEKNDDMIYLVPFGFYDKTSFETDTILSLEHWKMAIKNNSGYETTKIENVQQVTDLYLAKSHYIYFISKSEFSKIKGTYFLLTSTGTKAKAQIISSNQNSTVSFIGDYLYIGDMPANTYWCIAFVEN